MDDGEGYEKLIPGASLPSGRSRKVGIAVALCSIFIVCAAVSLVVRSADLEDKEYLISSLVVRSADLEDKEYLISCPDAVHRACNKTLYVDLCISSLSSYPGALHANLSDIPRIAVDVSLGETLQVYHYMVDLASKAEDKGEIMALQDCVQLLEDSVQQLQDSLSALTLPSKHKGDVQTWLSAALTNPSTCIQGLEDVGADSISVVRPKSENVTELISNALAIFVNSPSDA